MNDDDLFAPLDAPVSADQSDLPVISQFLPLPNIGEFRQPVQRPAAIEGIVLTPAQVVELRILRAREMRCQADIAEFWQRHMPGGLPAQRFK